MAKQTINIGTADKGDGDPIRTAFQKVNANFTELYTALGLGDNNLNLGSFEFTNNVMTTTDSSNIIIDQNVVIKSELTMHGDIVPNVANEHNLGSPTHPWGSLYVSNNTIYIGGNALKIDDNGDLTLNNNRIVQENGEYLVLDNLTDVSASSPSVGDVLTWNGGSWVNGSQVDLGQFKIANNILGTIDNPNTGGWGSYDLQIDPGGASAAGILIPSVSGQAGGTALQIYNLGNASSVLSLWGRGNVQVVTGQGITEKVFTFEGDSLFFPDGSLALTDSVLNNGLDADIKGSVFADDSTVMVDAVNNTLHAISVNTLGINLLNSADGILGPMGGYVLIGTSDGAGGSNTIATFDGSGIVFDQDVNMGAGKKIQSYTGDNLVLVSATGMGDFTWTFNAGGGLEMPGSLIFNEGYLYGDNNDHLHLMGEEDHYVKISSNNGAKSWWFNLDGSLTVPGDIKSEGNINIDINLSDSTLRRWQFGEDGYLTFPDATVQATAFTGNAATVDIMNTNGIDYNYSITFVENRSATQDLRADVDLTFNSWSNTLTTGNVAIKQTLTGGINDGSDFIITSQPNPNRNNACNIGIYPGLASGTASEAGFVSITGGGSDVVGLAGGDVYIRGGTHTNGGTNGTIRVESILKIDDGIHEKLQTKSNATGTVTHDCSAGHIFYHTSPSANWTINLTNLNLANGYATAVTIVIEQGGTGYYPSALQIAGNAQPFVWQGNTTPTPSTNRVDVVTFSILNNGLYTVLGQLTGF